MSALKASFETAVTESKALPERVAKLGQTKAERRGVKV